MSAPVAVGEPDPAATPESELDSAEALYNAGEQAYWLGDFRLAVELFEAAYTRSGLPALLYNVGLATMRRYELTQDPEDLRRARAVLTNYAQELIKDPELQQAENVPRLIAQLDAKLAALAQPEPVQPAAPSSAMLAAPERCQLPLEATPAREDRRAGAAVMTASGLVFAGGVASVIVFALKGQGFQQQQERILVDAAARGCGDGDASAACVTLEQARQITVQNGQRANLLAGGLGGGLMAIGAAGIVVGAVVYSRQPRADRLALTPSFTPSAGGLTLSGRF
ncbi:MAG: hypothetical protein IPK80_05170 [Nannocystis sp.]|nr:hypothetical protein [Nannocystis sp.]